MKMRAHLDLPTRDELIRIAVALQSLNPQLSFQSRTVLLQLLIQIIDQMPPRRDPRVNPLNWQIVMLAAALIDERNASRTSALLAAIQTLAPEREQDQNFREFIDRQYTKLSAGHNPARSQLLPVPPDLLAIARAKLPKQ